MQMSAALGAVLALRRHAFPTPTLSRVVGTRSWSEATIPGKRIRYVIIYIYVFWDMCNIYASANARVGTSLKARLHELEPMRFNVHELEPMRFNVHCTSSNQ